MRGTRPLPWLLGGIAALAIAGSARAEGESEAPAASALPVPPAPAAASVPAISRSERGSGPLIQAPKPKRGKRREQKETEGTEALERFQADTILKSPYTLDGQPLEVDPD